MTTLRLEAIGALALIAAAVVVVALPGRAVAHPDDGATRSAVVVSVPVTKDAVLAATKRFTAITRHVDRMEARLTTYGQFLDAANPGTRTAWPARETVVWVVAVSGELEPSGAHGMRFPWAVFAYDATTGNYIATAANDKGTWPAFFEALPDSSR